MPPETCPHCLIAVDAPDRFCRSCGASLADAGGSVSPPHRQRVQVDSRLIRSERLAAVGELAAGIAHNFNNILAAIGGDAQILKMMAEEEHLPTHVKETAELICAETMRGGRVAHDLLSFARGAAPHLQAVALRDVLEDVARLVSNHPAARGIAIQVEIGTALPSVEADPNLLNQVFFNLLLNALQAMPNGGMVTVSASVRSDETNPNCGLLDVRLHDTGVGISREGLSRAFDPFWSCRASGGPGSGLGLPVSLAMIRSLGGDIGLASAEGIGTTATVTLPIVERRIVPRGRGDGNRGRVLLLDDDPRVARCLGTLLNRKGFEVRHCTIAGEGQDGVGQVPGGYRLILMELTFGERGAGGMIRELRARNPAAPIVVLTGVTDPAALREALNAGAQFAFCKPPNYTELLAVLERLADAWVPAA